MSILDTIKKLFCSKSCKKTAKKNTKKNSVSKSQSAPIENKEPISEPVIENKESIPQPEPVIEMKAPVPDPVTAIKQEEAAQPIPVKESTPATAAIKKLKLQIPEDSALKRHFLSTLKAEIESAMPARPTDPTLRRQYDEEVQAEIDKRLN